MMSMISIDGKEIQFEEQITILEAARKMDIWIPTLCFNEHLTAFGGCRICLVEVATAQTPKRARLLPACSSRIDDGLIVTTDSDRVKAAQKFICSLLYSRCPESQQIADLALKIGVNVDTDNLDIVSEYLLRRAPKREETNCILCGMCVRVCAEVTERHALSFSKRGIERKVKTPFDAVAETCIGCGACAYVCPTKTITVEEVT